MSYEEFSNQFDVLYNNITSNQAPGCTEYEKSIFLTKAQDEIVKNYFLPQSNPKQAGYDDNQKRQADFSCLMKVQDCTLSNTAGNGKFICISSTGETTEHPGDYYDISSPMTAGTYQITAADTVIVPGVPANEYTITPDMDYTSGYFVKTAESSYAKLDSRSIVYDYPNDVFLAINESAVTTTNKILQVIPLRYDEYIRLMSKPFKRPLKNQAWRLINTGVVSSGNDATKCVELIGGPNESIASYTIRYVRKPKPIIVGDTDDLSINGYKYGTGSGQTQGCELDPMLHEEILQRAVELAKVAWTNTGQENMQAVIQAGQRSE